MPDGVLPAPPVLPVEGEIVHNVVVYVVEGEFFALRALDGHGDEGDVGERRSLVDFHHAALRVHGSLLAVAYDSCKERQRHGAGVVDSVQQRLLL